MLKQQGAVKINRETVRNLWLNWHQGSHGTMEEIAAGFAVARQIAGLKPRDGLTLRGATEIFGDYLQRTA